MRSSVAESRPSGQDTTQSPVAVPGSEFRSPRPQHQIPHPAAYRERQRSFSLAPSEGWLAMLLLAIALYSVVFSIISSDWVDNGFILPWSAAAGLLVGLCVAKIQRFRRLFYISGPVSPATGFRSISPACLPITFHGWC